MAQHNPFDKAEDFNPFETVAAYDPFHQTPSSAPKLVVNTQPPPEKPNDPFGPIDSFYDPNQPSVPQHQDDDSSFFSSPHTTVETGDSWSQSSSPGGSGRVRISTSEDKPPEEGGVSMWTLEYYQKFFNVDSSEVAWRCLRSLWPFKLDFVEFVRTNPDLYGPFWITATLIFTLAAAANFEDYFQEAHWEFDFVKLPTGAGIVWGFTFIIPLLLWGYFKWIDLDVSLAELFCIYGYSLFAYTPVSLICIAPFSYSQWASVLAGCLISTAFLVVNMWTVLRAKVGHAVLLLVLMALFHVAFGATVIFYWFPPWHKSPSPVTPTPPANHTL